MAGSMKSENETFVAIYQGSVRVCVCTHVCVCVCLCEDPIDAFEARTLTSSSGYLRTLSAGIRHVMLMCCEKIRATD